MVGPSGSGKTTLLGALTGMYPAELGEVVYGGRNLYAAYDELQTQIGLCPKPTFCTANSRSVRRSICGGASLSAGGSRRRAAVTGGSGNG